MSLITSATLTRSLGTAALARCCRMSTNRLRQASLKHDVHTPARRFTSTHWIKDSPWLGATTPKQVSESDVDTFNVKVASLTEAMLSSNWGDTVNLTLNVPFWESEYEELQKQIRAAPSLLADENVARQWIVLSTLLDLLFLCEDLRDHLNELMEYLDRVTSRESGAKESISNLSDHLNLALTRQQLMEEKCPQFKNKIDESVGRGLELMRKRVKFNWKDVHAAYY
eukprot:Blabericola_migrator_1__11886@NODE_724_length_6723_cov_141_689153_g521_i0_p4_GENE_NODE_724_length_6723_cov_141_689153_g521_i0NODE_724_length_6723_cov_141_689153_g521_i0_p4_ORF_typecomplete_len226_score32_38Laminin_I/PF06008_14/1_2e03Laminin_I/PF06008_14/0_0064VPS28/PF03997_12/0_011DUF87/PF01935_17/0_0092EzrA/PF06160_12/0_034DUF1949/PF09186_11/3e02DUF1949/PF09186_11/0_92Tropomyosin/PF00261_20/6_1e03Tropomyosin/PF00261_20/0_082DUF4404/PF14357_6/1_8e04DUF4404/PF14357_6/0_36_NODE_724_length_6723_cov